jgi:hypothetical protein
MHRSARRQDRALTFANNVVNVVYGRAIVIVNPDTLETTDVAWIGAGAKTDANVVSRPPPSSTPLLHGTSEVARLEADIAAVEQEQSMAALNAATYAAHVPTRAPTYR